MKSIEVFGKPFFLFFSSHFWAGWSDRASFGLFWCGKRLGSRGLFEVF